MKCALYLPNFGAFGDARTMAELAADAEAAGWDGFFIWDHIARPFLIDMVDPWVALAAIAVRTSTMRIGALVTPLPRRRPWKVARESVSIDRLSGGRLVFGVGTGGTGGRRAEWENLGEELDAKARGTMLDESLSILTALWSGEPYTHEGTHYRVHDVQFAPRPVQVPRIPVWVAGTWSNKPPLRRAARWDGVFPWFGPDGARLDKLQSVVDYVRAHRRDDTPFDIVYATRPLPRSPQAAAAGTLSSYAAAGVTWWLERIEPEFFGAASKGPWPFAQMRDHIRGGPPRR